MSKNTEEFLPKDKLEALLTHFLRLLIELVGDEFNCYTFRLRRTTMGCTCGGEDDQEVDVYDPEKHRYRHCGLYWPNFRFKATHLFPKGADISWNKHVGNSMEFPDMTEHQFMFMVNFCLGTVRDKFHDDWPQGIPH